MRRVIVAVLFCGTAVLSACGGGGGGTTFTSPTSQPTTTPSSAPLGSLTVNPGSEEFTATGASYAQTVTVTQSGYNGTYAESDDCSGIASVTAGANSTSFVVTPLGAGTCQVTFSGSNAKGTLSVGVTTSSVGVQ